MEETVMGKVATAKERRWERQGARQSERQFEEGMMVTTTGIETTQEVMVKAGMKEETR